MTLTYVQSTRYIFKKNIEVDKNNKVNNIIEYEKNYEDYIIIYKRGFLFPNEDL